MAAGPDYSNLGSDGEKKENGHPLRNKVNFLLYMKNMKKTIARSVIGSVDENGAKRSGRRGRGSVNSSSSDRSSSDDNRDEDYLQDDVTSVASPRSQFSGASGMTNETTPTKDLFDNNSERKKKQSGGMISNLFRKSKSKTSDSLQSPTTQISSVAASSSRTIPNQSEKSKNDDTNSVKDNGQPNSPSNSVSGNKEMMNTSNSISQSSPSINGDNHDNSTESKKSKGVFTKVFKRS
jgi:hypothetical protein